MVAGWVDSFCRKAEWDSSNFDHFALLELTPCFEEIIILGTIHVCVIIGCIFRIHQIRSSKYLPVQLRHRGWLRIQILLSVVLVLIPLFQLNAKLGNSAAKGGSPDSAYGSKDGLAPFQVTTLVLTCLAWALVATTLTLSHGRTTRKGLWIMRFLWIFCFTGQTIKFISVLKLYDGTIDYFFGLYIAQYCCSAVLALFAFVQRFHDKDFYIFSQMSSEDRSNRYIHLEEYPEGETDESLLLRMKQNEALAGQQGFYQSLRSPTDTESKEATSEAFVCPERNSGLWSRLTFGWLNALIRTGYSKPLEGDDVWNLDAPDTAEYLHKRFVGNWDHELKTESPSLVRALWKCFGVDFMFGGLPKILNDASQFVGPIFLNKLIMFTGDPDQPLWHGYVFALSIFFGQLIGALGEAQYFQAVMRVGMNVRSTLVTTIFRKAMVLRTSDGQMSSGKIANLMTSDAEALQNVCQNLHALWSLPLRIIIAMVLLYQQLSWAALCGASILILAIPIQKRIVGISARYLKQSLGRTDERIKLIGEVLASMNIVKCYAWENSFESSVGAVRDEELAWLRRRAYLSSFNSFLIGTIPILVSVISLSVYVAAGNTLTASNAFTALSLFGIIRAPLFILPQLITQLTSCRVSVQRLEDLLTRPEANLKAFPKPSPDAPAIQIKQQSFAHTLGDAKPTLEDISLSIPQGKFVAVIGGTGSGKSSLLSAILGDMASVAVGPAAHGPASQIRGSVAYVPQQAWIYNATVRENILFGLPFRRAAYQRAVRVSSLGRDLELLQPYGDLTEIGERGVNLSGGQKQRVSIARSVYFKADVYLFDDPLSALDAHVGKDIFEQCLKRELDGKTRVLATNAIHFISDPAIDHIVVMKKGRIDAQGSYQELMQSSESFRALMASVQAEDAEADTDEKAPSSDEDVKKSSQPPSEETDANQKDELVKKEHREKGSVRWEVVRYYAEAMGSVWFLWIILAGMVTSELARLGGSYWVSVWSGKRLGERSSGFYVGIYAAWSAGQALFSLFGLFVLAYASIAAARKLHNTMFATLLRAPMQFFHSTPLGRIINRFTKDTGDMDRFLALIASSFVRGLLQLLGTMVVIGVATPYTLATFVPVLALFYWCQRYFQRSSRELKRLDSVTRSPVYAHFQQALVGISSIRAFRAHDRMAFDNASKLDLNIRMNLASFSANRWLAIRLEFLGGIMILSSAVFVVMSRRVISPEVAGLSLSYALQITGLLNMTVRLATLAENSFNAVERMQEYAHVDAEAPPVIADHRPPDNWPDQGSISFKDVVMSYRADRPPVLRGLSFNIRGQQKIGICGRTGAGKSSVFVTLYRLTEISSGSMQIDGVDITKIGLRDLRERLSIIPQDPVLFTGTVRFNLDPFQQYDDLVLWKALERAYMREVIEVLPNKLSEPVTEGGANFSVGQRQLLCLARALLRRSKILVLDEATASVDSETDALIQATIREEFKECTTLTIAHRLNTIIDSDMVLVLDAGQAVEFDTPKNLILKPPHEGVFSSMVENTGTANAAYLRRLVLEDEGAALERYERDLQEAKAKHARALEKQKQDQREQRVRGSRYATQDRLEVLDNIGYRSSRVDEVRQALLVIREAVREAESSEWTASLQEERLTPSQWLRELSMFVGSLYEEVGHHVEELTEDEKLSLTQQCLMDHHQIESFTRN